MRHTFNIDKSVKVECEVDGNNVHGIYVVLPNGVTKDPVEILGLERAVNVKAAIVYMVSNGRKIVSATTTCGVTVYKGTI